MVWLLLVDVSCELIVSVFSLIDWNEVVCVFVFGGGVLCLGLVSVYLLELCQWFYDDVCDYVDDKYFVGLFV